MQWAGTSRPRRWTKWDRPSGPNARVPTAQVSNFSPVNAYANLKKPDGAHIVISSRNVFGPFQRWTPGPDTVQLQIGTSDHPMAAQMKSVFTGAPPVAILLFESQPAATSAHALVTTPVAVAGV